MPFGPFTLQWRTPSPNPPKPLPLPDGLSRKTIPTPSGPLELLYAYPPTNTHQTTTSPNSHPPTLFFAHGGFGSAAVWMSYMLAFAAKGYACYAVSYRGHGGSWYPSFLRMFFTGREAFGRDLVYGIEEAGRMERVRKGVDVEMEDMVLIAHSAGGGLSQYLLARGKLRVKGLCLFAAVPGLGSAAVYTHWLPIVPIQMPYRLFHPRYPLATTAAVKSSFFSPSMPLHLVTVFEQYMSPYESLWWPLQMILPVGKPVDILRGIVGSKVQPRTRKGREDYDGNSNHRGTVKQCLFVIAAEHDVLCRPKLMRDMAQKYRRGLADLVGSQDEKLRMRLADPDVEPEEWEGVRFRVVKGVGHHLQNEVEWERGIEEIELWLDEFGGQED